MSTLCRTKIWVPDELAVAPYLLGMSLMIAFDALTPFLEAHDLLLGLAPVAIADYFRIVCYLAFALAASRVRNLFHNGHVLTGLCVVGCAGVVLLEGVQFMQVDGLYRALSLVGAVALALFWSAGVMKFFELFSTVSLNTAIVAFIVSHLLGSLFATAVVMLGNRVVAVCLLGLMPLALLALIRRYKGAFVAPVASGGESGAARAGIPFRPLILMLVTLFVAALVRSNIPERLEPISYCGALVCAFALMAVMEMKRRAVHPRTLYHMTLFMLMTGLLLFTVQGDFFRIASGSLVNGGYLAFDVLVVALLCNICRRYALNTYWVLGLMSAVECLAFDAGNAAGRLLAAQPESTISLGAFACAVVVAFAFVTLLTDRDYRTSWGAMRDEGRQPSVALYYHTLGDACQSISEQYGLTRREEDVLLLLAQRKTVPDIERELYISNSTAKTHCKNIYRKLGIHKRDELLALMGHPSVSSELPTYN